MTANELLIKQLHDTSFQIEKVLEGVKEGDVDFKPISTTMSIREQLQHLCEVYTAVAEEFQGVHHQWGSYQVPDPMWQPLLQTFHTLRTHAITVVSEPANDATTLKASEYMVAHEYYHVGQLASLRIATDSSWNPFSIYNH